MTHLTRNEPQPTKQVPTTTQAVRFLLLTMLDTTWRMFVPTIGGTVLGIALDTATGRAPLFTTIAIIFGFATSGLLVTLQIRRIRKLR